jgi:hypothetical protein
VSVIPLNSLGPKTACHVSGNYKTKNILKYRPSPYPSPQRGEGRACAFISS